MASAWERWQQENANDQSQTDRPPPKSETAASGGFFESFDEAFPSTALAESPGLSSQHKHDTSRATGGNVLTTHTAEPALNNQTVASPSLRSRHSSSAAPQTNNKHNTAAKAPAATGRPALPAIPVATGQAPPGWAVINASDAQGGSSPGPSLSMSLPDGQSSKDRAAPHATAPPQNSTDTAANVDGSMQEVAHTHTGKGLVSLHGPTSGFASLLASVTSDPPARRSSHTGSVGAPQSPNNSRPMVARSEKYTAHAHEPSGLSNAHSDSRQGHCSGTAQGISDRVQQTPSFDASELPLGAGTAEALAAALRKAREAMPEHNVGVKPQHVAAPPQPVPEVTQDESDTEGRGKGAEPAPKRRGGLFGLFGRGGGGGVVKVATDVDAAAVAASEDENLRDVDARPASAAALEAAAAAVAAEPAEPDAAGIAAAEVARECMRLERVRRTQAHEIAAITEEVVALREEAVETAGELDSIRQAYAEVRGEQEEAAEQVEQLLDKYCDAVRDTAMLVVRLERYRCDGPLLLTVLQPRPFRS